LFAHTLSLLSAVVTPVITGDGGFVSPSIDEFYPEAVFFGGTPLAINRIMLIRFLVLALLLVLVLAWTKTFARSYANKSYVPSRFQMMGEISVGFVRRSIAHDQLGQKDGDRFLPLLTTIFFLVLGMNITGIIPTLNIAGSSLIGLPLVLAMGAYVTFIYAGFKKHGFKFLKTALLPNGVPKVFLPLVFLIELLSTFILRPVTLALRLTMNMVAGHLLLVLCFAATQYFFFESSGLFKVMGVGTLTFGFVFTLFEILVAFLQAYVFTLLTTVYIQLALADDH
jgi:F-type H+-transporting ATPase subunit a